jgi:hypothetical protein
VQYATLFRPLHIEQFGDQSLESIRISDKSVKALTIRRRIRLLLARYSIN